MAWSLQIPITGVSSLEVLAANASYFDGYICPLFFDARRQQIYTGLYTYEDTLKVKEEERIILISEWLLLLKELNQKKYYL
ncbi:hypothetical protein GCM10020331_016420 [Ectobacillus funiculus]